MLWICGAVSAGMVGIRRDHPFRPVSADLGPLLAAEHCLVLPMILVEWLGLAVLHVALQLVVAGHVRRQRRQRVGDVVEHVLGVGGHLGVLRIGWIGHCVGRVPGESQAFLRNILEGLEVLFDLLDLSAV